MSSSQFVAIYHPGLLSTALVSPQSVDEWYAKGWLLVDPAAPPPVVDTPYYTKEALLSQIQGGGAPIGAALRAALVPRPTGGSDGQILVKAGADFAWADRTVAPYDGGMVA